MAEESRTLLYETTLRLAAAATDPNERLQHFEAALKLQPSDELACAIAALRLKLVAGPTYVAKQQARILGRRDHGIVGNVFVLQDDGSLKPASGQDLMKLNERHPQFIRDWRLDEG